MRRRRREASEQVRVVDNAGIKAIGKVNALRPTEADFKGKRGYWRRYRPDGGYEWGYKYKPNDQGKVTREGAEVNALMAPFIKADTARHLASESVAERAPLRDGAGGVRYVDPALAENTARRNGWSHVWRAGGNSVERGVDGMLFRRWRDGWEPLGVRCLGTPVLPQKRLASPQHDPGGEAWYMREGRWVRD